MTRTRTFTVEVSVSAQFASDQPMTIGLAHTILRDKAAQPLTGPRGGRYVAVGDVHDIRVGQIADDFIRGRWSFSGRVEAKYQRPGPVNRP